MAETDDTTTDETPEAEVGAHAAEGGGSETPEASGPSRSETRAASRRQAASSRPSRSPEERQAERDEERKRKAAARRRRRPRERERAKARRAASVGQATPPHDHGPGRPKVRQGVVTSDKADKTITVRIDVSRRHRRYEKIVRSSATLHAHDEANDAHTGDTVRIVEARPLSATKRWRLVQVLERAE